jgi:hypothetical protein
LSLNISRASFGVAAASQTESRIMRTGVTCPTLVLASRPFPSRRRIGIRGDGQALLFLCFFAT